MKMEWIIFYLKSFLFIQYTDLKTRQALDLKSYEEREWTIHSLESQIQERDNELEQICEEYEALQLICDSTQHRYQETQEKLEIVLKARFNLKSRI
jgi:peptidoglycan hydrolase CwlO-like protein